MKRRSFLKFFGLSALIPSALLAKPKAISDIPELYDPKIHYLKTEPFVMPNEPDRFHLWSEAGDVFMMNDDMHWRDKTGNGNHLGMRGFSDIKCSTLIHFDYAQSKEERAEVTKIISQSKKALSGHYSSMKEFRKAYRRIEFGLIT